MSKARDDLNTMKGRLSALTKALPEASRAFASLQQAATKDGAFSSAQKELIAVAIACGQGCEGCILYHTDKAKSLGASREDLLEVLAVAVEMGGGPGMVYAAKALEAYDALVE